MLITRQKFTEEVESLIVTHKVDVISAVLKTCEKNNIEPEAAKRLLSQPLKEKLEAEATKLKFINRGNSSQGVLPI